MKSKLLALVLAAGFSASAFAAPALTLPAGGLYLKFNGFEQASVAPGAYTYPGSTEINWGVFTMTTIFKGAIDNPHDTLAQDDGDGTPIFSTNPNYQITGMFYDVHRGVASATNPFPATGGIIDLYYRDLTKYSYTNNSAKDETVRTAMDQAAGYTQGEFLVRLKFATGMDTNPANYIVGSAVPTANAGTTGVADSYADVDMTKAGAWSNLLNSNYFLTQAGDLRDLRFKNSYNYSSKWNNGNCPAAPAKCPAPTDGIIGLRLDDPAMAYVVPEPGALSLMGLALLGMAAIRRRKQK